MRVFWVVWRFSHCENGAITTSGAVNPSKLHDSYDAAKDEAIRLAGYNPNVIFTVCEVHTIGSAIMSDVNWRLNVP